MTRFSAFLILVAASAWPAALGQIALVVDPPPVSLVMDDFNDGVDTMAGFFSASSAGEAAGVASVLVPAGAADPQVQFPNSGGPFGIAKYPHFRLSSRSEFGGGGQVFPLPPSGVTVVGFQTGTAFAESQLTFVTDPPGANGAGLRVDPIGSGGGAPDTFQYDYVILDKFQTVGVAEYDRDGGTEGFDVIGNGHISNVQASAASSSLTATTNGVDPILQRTGLSLDTSVYTVLEVRVAFDPLSSSRFEVFWGTDAHPGPAGGQSLVVTGELIRDGQLHTYRFQMSDDTRWAGNLQVLRVDPLADADAAAGRSIEIDYVRLIAGAPVVDSDFDGIPDDSETNTGIFVDGCATGTDPNNADSDGDGFDDGAEVRSGTDPNDAGSVPGGSLDGYADAPVIYGLGAPIFANFPEVGLGVPSGFSVSPPLPAGLNLDSFSGDITGTPSALTPAADYTITASFDGSPDSSFDLNIEVSNPFIQAYGFDPASYQRGVDRGFNDPILNGAGPNLFTVSPPLPDGLTLDPNDGSISGIATGFQAPADYTITAGYDGFPDSNYTLSIEVEATPVLLVDPAQALTSYVSLGEFNFEGDVEGWVTGNAVHSAAGGLLVVNTTAGDPQVFKGGLNLATAGGVNSVLEFRLRQPDDVFVEFFWGDGNGGLSAARRLGIESADIPSDGDFHVYQIDMTGVFQGAVNVIRLDPGPGEGRTVEIDYVRLGSFTALDPPRLTDVFYDPDLGEAVVTWTSSPGETFLVEVSTDLESWGTLAADFPAATEGETTSFLDVVASLFPEGFYRVTRIGN